MTALNYCTVTGTWGDGSGSAVSGTVVFTPSATVYASGLPVVVSGVPVQAMINDGQLQADNGGQVRLLATDNEGVSLSGGSSFWFWSADVQISAGASVSEDSWNFPLPYSADPVDLYSTKNLVPSSFPNPMTAPLDLIIGGEDGTPERLASPGGEVDFLRSDGTWAVPPGAGGGTVASVAVESANGFAGTVADATTTPQVTLKTTVNGLLKGNSTSGVVSTAAAGTDYVAPNGSGASLTGITATQVGADASGLAAAAQSAAQTYAEGVAAAAQSAAEAASVSVTGGGKETVSALGSVSGTQVLNLADGNVFTVTATGNLTFEFSGATSGVACLLVLYLTQDATGGRTVTWPGSVTWIGGTSPALDTAANALSELIFETVDGGTTWYGSAVQEVPALPLTLANGGTGQVTQQAALNALAGSVTAAQVLAGDGTNVTLRSLAAGDIPDLSSDYLPTDGGTVDGLLSPVVTAVTFASTVTLPVTTNVLSLTLTGACTVNAPASANDGDLIRVRIIGANAHAVTWGTGWDWGTAGAPTLAGPRDRVVAEYVASASKWDAAVDPGHGA